MDHADGYTPCEEYGHRYDIDGEQFEQCIDCGEPRDTGEEEGVA